MRPPSPETLFPACAACHVTMRVYHPDLEPERLTEELGVPPTRCWKKGAVHRGGSYARPPAPHGGWILESRESVDSADLREHLDWLLARLKGRQAVLKRLRKQGCRVDVLCYWLSASGHGGPVLEPVQMLGLGRLGLELSFDVYFAGE